MATAVVPEARELNSFLISVAAEVDSVVDPLLRELDQRAEAVRVGQAALDLPCSANRAPIEPPRESWGSATSPSRMAVSHQGGTEKGNNGEPAQHSSVNYRLAARPKKTFSPAF